LKKETLPKCRLFWSLLPDWYRSNPPPLDITSSQVEDDGDALARQLIIYKRFKELAAYIQEREEKGLRTYLRVAPPPTIMGTPKLDLEGIDLDDLVAAAHNIFFNQNSLASLDTVVSIPRITIREKIHAIMDRLMSIHQTTFRSMLTPGTPRIEIVVTFLALLELVKRHIVAAEQDNLFGDISLEPVGELNENESFTIDFDEESSNGDIDLAED
jgi:segregation and condensation protein A